MVVAPRSVPREDAFSGTHHHTGLAGRSAGGAPARAHPCRRGGLEILAQLVLLLLVPNNLSWHRWRASAILALLRQTHAVDLSQIRERSGSCGWILRTRAPRADQQLSRRSVSDSARCLSDFARAADSLS